MILMNFAKDFFVRLSCGLKTVIQYELYIRKKIIELSFSIACCIKLCHILLSDLYLQVSQVVSHSERCCVLTDDNHTDAQFVQLPSLCLSIVLQCHKSLLFSSIWLSVMPEYNNQIRPYMTQIWLLYSALGGASVTQKPTNRLQYLQTTATKFGRLVE